MKCHHGLYLSFMMGMTVVLSPSAYAKICGPIDVKGKLTGLRQLTNCTIVRGSVTISMINYKDNNSTSLIFDWRFPELREITGHFILAYTNGLVRFADVFPNLVVIRGNKLADRFALLVFDNEGLEHVAFESLTTIQHGFAMIQRNPKLCYAHAIDWHRITVDDEIEVKGHEYFIQNTTYNVCPTVRDCTKCNPQHCWDADHCQKSESGLSLDGALKCHPLCLGGCVNETADGCSICRGPTVDGHCVDKCPEDRFINPLLGVCTKNCGIYNMFNMNGTCLYQCPAGWSHLHDPRKELDYYNCYKCKKRCPVVCIGRLVSTLEETKVFQGCTVINGSLYFRLEVEFSDKRHVLDWNFRHLEEIHGALIITRSAAITNLNFLQNLTLIDYLPPSDEYSYVKASDRFAVQVFGNPNINQLWDFEKKLNKIQILGGSVMFHHNPKLCTQEIDNFIHNVQYNNTHDFIEPETNGYEEICVFENIKTSVILHTSSSVTVIWEPFEVKNKADKLFGYEVYYMETTLSNITYRFGVDACSVFQWMTDFVEVDDYRMDRDSVNFRYTLSGLSSNKQYAYYVKAHVSVKTEKAATNVTQGQSEVLYFRTFPKVPLPPFVQTKNKTAGSITLSWFHPSWDADSLVERYLLDVYQLSDPFELVDQRNYCRNPKEHTITELHKYVTNVESKVWCCTPRHDRFVTGFFGLDGDPDMCGPADPNCEKQVTYHMLDANTTYGIDEMDAIREEELPFLDFPLPKNPQYQGSSQRFELHQRHRHYVNTDWIDGNEREKIISGLIPFERYAFQVYACNHQGCSSYFLHYERTLRHHKADSISVSVSRHDKLPNAITVHVVPPRFPNGKTVAYIFERQMSNTLQRICVTPAELAKSFNNFNFLNLAGGHHTVRARSISLGSDGPWSADQVVIISGSSDWRFSVISVICIVTLAIFGYCMYSRFWKRRDRVVDVPSDEGIRLADMNRRSSDTRAPILRMAPVVEESRIQLNVSDNKQSANAIRVIAGPSVHQQVDIDFAGVHQDDPTPSNTHDRVRLISMNILDSDSE